MTNQRKNQKLTTKIIFHLKINIINYLFHDISILYKPLNQTQVVFTSSSIPVKASENSTCNNHKSIIAQLANAMPHFHFF